MSISISVSAYLFVFLFMYCLILHKALASSLFNAYEIASCCFPKVTARTKKSERKSRRLQLHGKWIKFNEVENILPSASFEMKTG